MSEEPALEQASVEPRKRSDLPLLAGLAALGGAGLGIGALAWKASETQPQQIIVQQPSLPPIGPPIIIQQPPTGYPPYVPPTVEEASAPTGPLSVDYSKQLPSSMPLTQTPAVYVDVPPLTSAIIYNVTIPPMYYGVVQYVGNNMFVAFDKNSNPLFYYNFLIDGELVEKVVRIIADINAPRLVSPGFVATKKIQWICVNNTSDVLRAQVVCDGFMKRRLDR